VVDAVEADDARRTVPFERLKPTEADSWRLKHLATAEAAGTALRGGTKCSVADLLPTVDVTVVTDERFRFAAMQQYFTDEAWDRLCAIINMELPNIEWHCQSCSSSASGRWVQCDRCLAWLHFACVGISRKPRGHFFCTKCK